MAKIGTHDHPAVLRLNDDSKQDEILAMCDKYGIIFIAGLEPDKQEDISDLRKLISPKDYAAIVNPNAKKATPPLELKRPVGRNAPCPCGSGKQYKRCCGKC